MSERILIVGAGIIGLGIAWQMAKAGREVLVLEARKPGRGASWAAAGILSARLQGGDPRDPTARLMRQSQALWPNFATELEAATGLELGLRREGTIALATNAAEAESFAELAGELRAAEHGFRWLDPELLAATEPALAAGGHGGLLSRLDHQIDPRAVVKALRIALEDAGGELRPGTPVQRVIVENDRVRGVETDTGIEHAAGVVLAAGAWTERIEGLPGALRPPVRPLAGQMLALLMDPAKPLLRHVVMLAGGYLVPRRDGRLLVGATSEERGFDGRHTPRGLGALIGLLETALPAALDLPLEESWVGFRPATPDHRPILGPTPVEGLALATGHGHNGVLMAPATIEAICVGLITGEWDEGLRPFMLERFQ